MQTLTQRGSEAVPLRDEELLPLKEVCRLFGGIDPSTIYRNVRRGVIPAPRRRRVDA